MFSFDYFFPGPPVKAYSNQKYSDVMKIRLGVPILKFISIRLRLISHFHVIVILPAQLMWWYSYSLLLDCRDLAAESRPPKVCFRMMKSSASLCQFCLWKDNYSTCFRNTFPLLTKSSCSCHHFDRKVKIFTKC